MSTTLTNGLKLPDKGSVDWYADMQSNYAILDGAVGTVAEHSTQIAGKAPLVHTHTKSDITDFPAYGNTAGTICEGNDSRLSDARTPVAHTHLTADVTDLLNSAHTWSGDNTYSKTVAIERSTDTGNFLALKNTVAELGSTPASATPVTIAFRDKDNDNLGYMGVYYDTDGSNHFRLYVRNKYTSGAPSTTGSYDYAFFGLRLNADKSKEGIIKASFRPYDNNTHDLGSSSYQWNKLYAKNYYYNGVAWGLDKANTWGQVQTISYSGVPTIRYIHPSLDIGSAPASDCGMQLNFCDAGTNVVSAFQYIKGSGVSRISIVLSTKNSNSQIIEKTLRLQTNQEGTNWDFYPSSNGEINLGTSNNKFKTLNGVNPGALSLPDISDADPIYTNNWVGDNSSSNQYTPTENGWIYFRVEGANKNITIRYGGAGGDAPSITSESTLSHVSVFFPVRSGVTMYIFFNGTMVKAFFYPCLGNV